jgi:EmrB/QacA subfamily drug resistance transporter
MARQHTKQSTLFRSRALYAPPPVMTIRAKPVKPWRVLTAVLCGFFMAVLDTTIVNIAIPSIQTGLSADLRSISWVLNTYNLMYAVLLITVGRFADQYGRKRQLLIAMILFSLGSLGCALAQACGRISGAPAMSWLIGFRALQGIGAAGLTPVSLAILMAVFPRHKRGAALGVWGAVAGMGAAFGPIIGGLLVQTFDWRWIFLVNLPICAVGIVLALLCVPETRDPSVSRHIDVPGLLTLTLAILCLVVAINQGNEWGWSSVPMLSLFGAAVGSVLLFVLVEVWQREPLVDLSLFKAGSFTGTNITVLLFGIALQGATLIAVLYFTNALGYRQLQAAYALLPIALASFVTSLLAGKVSSKLTPSLMCLAGMAMVAVGLGLLGLLSPLPSLLVIAWCGLLMGGGIGMAFQSLPMLSLAQVPHAKLGVGSGVFNTFRLLGGVLGVAILVSVLTGQLHTNLEQASRTAGALAHAPVTDAFRTTWLCAALCAVMGFVWALLISAMHRPLTRKEAPVDETEHA